MANWSQHHDLVYAFVCVSFLADGEVDESEKEDWIKYGAKIDIEPQRGIGLIDVILNIAPWLLIIFFWFYMTRRMQGGGGGQGGIFNFIKSKAKMVSPEMLKTTFKDVAGCEEAKI